MVQQVTVSIKMSVETDLDGTDYKNYKVNNAIGCKITIKNKHTDTAQ